jgi:hypothetical protein
MVRRISLEKAQETICILHPIIKERISKMVNEYQFVHQGPLELSAIFLEELINEANQYSPIKLTTFDDLKRAIKITFSDYYFKDYGSGLYMDIIPYG